MALMLLLVIVFVVVAVVDCDYSCHYRHSSIVADLMVVELVVWDQYNWLRQKAVGMLGRIVEVGDSCNTVGLNRSIGVIA